MQSWSHPRQAIGRGVADAGIQRLADVPARAEGGEPGFRPFLERVHLVEVGFLDQFAIPGSGELIDLFEVATGDAVAGHGQHAVAEEDDQVFGRGLDIEDVVLGDQVPEGGGGTGQTDGHDAPVQLFGKDGIIHRGVEHGIAEQDDIGFPFFNILGVFPADVFIELRLDVARVGGVVVGGDDDPRNSHQGQQDQQVLQEGFHLLGNSPNRYLVWQYVIARRAVVFRPTKQSATDRRLLRCLSWKGVVGVQGDCRASLAMTG